MMATRTVGIEVPHLQAWRLRRLMKQGELAAAAGVSRFTVQRAERGERVSITNVRKLAQALGVTADQLRYVDPEAKG